MMNKYINVFESDEIMEQEYKDLLQKYNILLEENKKLKTGLALLRGETSISMPTADKIEHIPASSINKYSS